MYLSCFLTARSPPLGERQMPYGDRSFPVLTYLAVRLSLDKRNADSVNILRSDSCADARSPSA